mgnify:FL=1
MHGRSEAHQMFANTKVVQDLFQTLVDNDKVIITEIQRVHQVQADYFAAQLQKFGDAQADTNKALIDAIQMLLNNQQSNHIAVATVLQILVNHDPILQLHGVIVKVKQYAVKVWKKLKWAFTNQPLPADPEPAKQPESKSTAAVVVPPKSQEVVN